MESVAFTVPFLTGAAGEHCRALLSCWEGDRREAYRDACRRAGITREGVWVQPESSGPVAVVYLEADDLEAARDLRASSGEPFDRWFRGRIRCAHGPALGAAAGRAEPVLDFDVDMERT